MNGNDELAKRILQVLPTKQQVLHGAAITQICNDYDTTLKLYIEVQSMKAAQAMVKDIVHEIKSVSQ